MIISIRKRFNNPPVNQTQVPNNHKIASTLTVNGNGRHPIGNGDRMLTVREEKIEETD